MTPPRPSTRLPSRLLARLRRDGRGSTMVEYALTVALFLLLFFAVLDFGRLLYNWNMSEKAMQIAARMAAVRPPVCGMVPESNVRGTSTLTGTRFGDSCTVGGAICAGNNGGTARSDSCFANDVGVRVTATEIWTRIQPLLPPNASQANLRFTYTFDDKMNFLGGPYVPVVTAELVGTAGNPLVFEFLSPIMGLVGLASGATTGTSLTTIPFPPLSVSLPGEDLNLGTAG